MMDRILIVDDDTELCGLVTRYLTREGFDITAVHDGAQGVEAALSGEYVILVLDVMLPGLSGFEVLRRLRAESDLPVLMLTARGDDVDRIVGLEIGADDYLPKPFNPRELVARIRAILRRTSREGEPRRRGERESGRRGEGESGRAGGAETNSSSFSPSPTLPLAHSPSVLRGGDVEIDLGARVVRRAGEVVELTGAEFDLLVVLLRQAGHVISRQELVRSVLDRPLMPLDRSIDTLVSNLRRKLGHTINGVERIKSVRGSGYVYARLDEVMR